MGTVLGAVKDAYRSLIRKHILPIFPIVDLINGLHNKIMTETTPPQVLFFLGFLKNHPEDICAISLSVVLYFAHTTALLGFLLEPALCAVFPTWEALKALENKNSPTCGRLLIYFTIFGFTNLLETLCALRANFYYPYIKVIASLALLNPEVGGIELIEAAILEPYLFNFLGISGGGKVKRASMTMEANSSSFVDLSKLSKVTEVTIVVRKINNSTDSSADDEINEGEGYYATISQEVTGQRQLKHYESAVFRTPLNPSVVKQVVHVDTKLQSKLVFEVAEKRTFGTDPVIGTAKYELSNMSDMMKKVSEVELDLVNDGGVGGTIIVDISVDGEDKFIE